MDALLTTIAEIVRTPAFWGFIGVLAGGLITGFVTIRAEAIRAEKAGALDSAKRQDDRQLNRDNFQRENLIQLQEALGAWMRVQVRTEMADLEAFRQTGQLGRHGDELGAAQLATGQRLVYLTERVKDDDLRDRLTALRSQGIPPITRNEAELDAASTNLAFAADSAYKHVGRVLRAYL